MISVVATSGSYIRYKMTSIRQYDVIDHSTTLLTESAGVLNSKIKLSLPSQQLHWLSYLSRASSNKLIFGTGVLCIELNPFAPVSG